jgi:hypothetical protein
VEHEFSGYTVNGIRKGLEKLGFAAEVIAAVSPATREALSHGSTFKFHPGPTMDEVLEVLSKLRGPDAVAALMEETTRSSLEGIVAPLARMYLTFKGSEPSVLFERFNDLLRGTTRGITAKWTPTGPRQGRIDFTYVMAVAASAAHGWRGAVRYMFTFCGAVGEVSVEAPSADRKTVSLAVRWAAPPEKNK